MAVVVEIRWAAPREQGVLSELHRRSSWISEQDRVHLEAHPEALGVAAEAIAQARVRVAVAAGEQPLGFSVTADGGGGVCVLDDLFVDPDFLREGIGRALVEDAADLARAAGSRLMTVVAHPRNLPFYESVGFTPGEPARTRFGPAILMRRTLAGGTEQRHARAGDPRGGGVG